MARTRSFDPEAVVDAAVEQFWTTSFRATSTEDLCTSSQLSRSSLYNTFGSKRELYLLALTRYMERKQEQRAELLERELTGRELLREIGRASLTEQWQDESRRACLGINASVEIGPSEPEIMAKLERNAADFDAIVEIAVSRGQQDGSLRDDVPAQQVARALHAAMDGLQVRARITPALDDVLCDLDALISLL